MTHDSQLPSQRSSLVLDPADQEMNASADQRRQQLLALLRGRWHWAILLGVLLGSVFATAGYFYVEPVYTSTGSISIAPDQRPGSEVTGGIPQYDRFLALQADRMRSTPVIEAALNHEAWQRAGGGSTAADVRRFAGHLYVGVPRGEQQLNITFTGETPELAAAGVEAIIAGYQRIFSQQVNRVDSERMRKLENQHDQIEGELTSLQDDRAQLLNEAGGPGVTARLQRVWERLWNVDDMLAETQRQLEAAESVQQGEQPALSVESVQEIARQDGRMRQLLSRREEIQSQIQSSIELGIGRNHRRMEQLRAELDGLNRRIQDYAREYAGTTQFEGSQGGMTGAVVGSPEMMRARIADLRELRTQLQSEAQSLGQYQLELSEIEENIEIAKQRLRSVESDIRTQQLKPSDAARVEVTDTGSVAEINSPSNDGKRKQLTLMGAVGGLGMGFGLIALIGLLDRRFRRVDDAQLTLPSTRLLGILPTLPDNLADPEQASVAAHCVHHIRTMLQIGGTERRGRVFTVTSPAPGSGKTSLASALGVSFAASGAKTLLIDCDVVGGGLSRRLGCAAHRSLEDILRREGMVTEQALADARRAADAAGQPLSQKLLDLGYVDADDLDRAKQLRKDSAIGLLEACDGEPFEHCLADTGIGNLYLLPIGGADPDHAGSLSPTAVQRLLNKARGRFDTVVIDTGPILGSIEASMTAAEADHTILVVSRGDQKHMVVRSLESLKSVHAEIAGIVFNHATTDDVQRSSYASVASHRPDSAATRSQPVRADPDTAARFGPIGSAVVSHSRSHRHEVAHDESHAGNGASSGNGVSVRS